MNLIFVKNFLIKIKPHRWWLWLSFRLFVPSNGRSLHSNVATGNRWTARLQVVAIQGLVAMHLLVAMEIWRLVAVQSLVTMDMLVTMNMLVSMVILVTMVILGMVAIHWRVIMESFYLYSCKNFLHIKNKV